MEDLVGYALPLYVKEGKSQLTIAVAVSYTHLDVYKRQLSAI